MTPMLRLERLTRKPIEAIQGTVAIAMFLFGLWVVSPIYVTTSSVNLAVVFGSSLGLRFLFCLALFVLPALSTLIGFFNAKYRTPLWRARGCMAMFVGLLGLTLLRFFVVGIFPPVWLFYLATSVISALLYLYWRVPK